MKNKVVFVFIVIMLLFSVVFTGCQTGASGIPQADYDAVLSQLTAAKSDLVALQTSMILLDGQLAAAQEEITALESQLAVLQAEYGLVGATPAETAQKIVDYYHKTHVYSSYDLFICSDMAADVWNMLKAQGISSLIAVGNINIAITDILQSDHAWVLAEVAPGQYLALETTGGFTVTEGENPLYYQGWSFDSPADLKSYHDLVQVYNTWVVFRNILASETNKAAELYNNASTPAEADKWLALHDKLQELLTDQETILNALMAQINSLAAVIQ